MSTTEIFQDAERALAEAQQDDSRGRLQGMTGFMQAFERLANELELTHESWESIRPWALGVVERVQASRAALGEWQIELGELFYNASRDEVDVEAALDRRSQHAFAREAFRDTPVDAMLAEFEDAEFDRDLRDEAQRLSIDGPSYAPVSHSWWRRAA